MELKIDRLYYDKKIDSNVKYLGMLNTRINGKFVDQFCFRILHNDSICLIDSEMVNERIFKEKPKYLTDIKYKDILFMPLVVTEVINPERINLRSRPIRAAYLQGGFSYSFSFNFNGTGKFNYQMVFKSEKDFKDYIERKTKIIFY